MALRNRLLPVNSSENVTFATKGTSKMATTRAVLGDICHNKVLSVKDRVNHTSKGVSERKPLAINEPREINLDGLMIHGNEVQQLPPDVLDIDRDDENNIYLLPDYVNEIYRYLRSLEDKYKVRKQFLMNTNVSSRMRAVLIDWLVEVQVQYKLMQETLHLSVGILDRFLQEVPRIQKEKFQLVGITCLFIACKFEEMYPPELNDFVYVTDSAYTSDEILAMEREILKKLSFCLGRPISLVFLRRFSKAAMAQPIHHTLGKYFIELALLEYSIAHVKPSLIAAASLFLALCFVSGPNSIGPNLWTKTLEHYSAYTFADLASVIPTLLYVIRQALKSRFQAIPNKYSTNKNLEVSQKQYLREESPIFAKLNSLIPKSG